MEIRLHYSGHYPDKVVHVNTVEFNALRKLEKEYGSLYDARRKSATASKFINVIEERPPAPMIPQFHMW